MRIPNSSGSLGVFVTVVLIGCSAPDDHPHDNNENHHHHDEDAADHHHDQDVGDEHDAGHTHDGDSGHADEDVSVDVGADVTITPAARDYCECMLVSCHEPFHQQWGESDPVAIANCEAEASALPVAGSEQTSGNSIECRQYHCDQAADGEDTCASALGGGQCQ